MRILQIGMTRNVGGLETYLMSQFRKLKKVSYDFMNITGEYEIVFADEITRRGGKIFAVPSRHLSPISHYFGWIKFFFGHAKDYDAIVLNSNNLLYVFPLFAARFFGIKTRVFHSHNAGMDENLGFVKQCVLNFNKLLLKISATHLFACSELAGKVTFGDKKFRVIRNAIDIEKFRFNETYRSEIRNELGLKDEFVLGHAGRFTYQKNHEFLIEVFAKVKEKEPSAKLLLAGDAVEDMSFLENAKEQVEDLGLTGSVYFLGMRNDAHKLFSAMDVFLLPSRFEGLPLVGIESQAAGLPSIFSDVITKELGITPASIFLPLNDVSVWAEEILKFKGKERKDYSELIAKAGYSVEDEAGKVEKFFLNA